MGLFHSVLRHIQQAHVASEPQVKLNSMDRKSMSSHALHIYFASLLFLSADLLDYCLNDPRNRGSTPSHRKIFSSQMRPDRTSVLPSLLSSACCVFLAGHSPPSSAGVKNEWLHTSTSSYAFVACICTISTSLAKFLKLSIELF